VPDPSVPSGEGYLCPAFDPSTSRCRIYDVRPLDCQLYPLALMWSADGSEVLLGWDSKCPFLQEQGTGHGVQGAGLEPRASPPDLEAYAARVTKLLEREDVLDTFARHPRLIGRFQEDVVALRSLPRLTERLRVARETSGVRSAPHPSSLLTPHASPFTFHALEFADRPKLEQAMASADTPLAHYAFATHFVWRERFSYRWAEVGEYFCLFAEYHDGLFMPLPPLPSGGAGLAPREAYLVDSQPRASRFTLLSTGARFGAQALHAEHPSSFANVLAACFAFMRERNKGTAVSRIENIPEELKLAFESLGYHLVPKDPDYLYRASDLAGLVGDRYKSQRAACNRFVRVYATAKLEAYHEADSDECLALFRHWAAQKRQEPCDEMASHMLSDAESAHREALVQPEALGLVGRVVRVGAAIRGYTFGYRRSASVFCVLFEVADRTIPGLAQFMFRELCREAAGEGYEFVNTMDDSGLPSLARSKRAYHPVRLVPSFIATER
jgi:hypothetical protein